jgi:iron complex outermembrane receptor protein
MTIDGRRAHTGAARDKAISFAEAAARRPRAFLVRPCASAARAILAGAAIGAALAGPALAQAGSPGPARASAADTVRFHIAPGPLAPALRELASLANVLLTFTGAQVEGKTTAGVQGPHTYDAALAVLLAGTGLQAVRLDNGGYVLRAAPPPEAGTSPLPQVTVTADADVIPGLPRPYAGGQVARGGRVGLLGDKGVMDTPFNITSYTAQTIEDQQARSIADVVDNSPSLRPIYPGNDAMTDFAARGNKVMALNSAYGGLYGMMSPGVEALERVEVISGANALLNGLGPVGGVGGSINQVSKRAAEAPLTRVTLGAISDAQWGTHADLSRRFGEDKQLGIRFNGALSRGDTAVERQSKSMSMAALALDWRSDRVRLSADFGYRRNDTDSPSRTTFVAAGFDLPPPPASGKNWQQSWSYDNVQSSMASVRGEVDLADNLSAFAAAGYSRYEEAQLFANTQLQSNAGKLLQNLVYWPLYRQSSTAEAGLRGRFATGPIQHHWSVSASALQVRNGIVLTTLASIANNLYTPVTVAQPSLAGLAGPGEVPKTASVDFSGFAAADTLSAFGDRVQLTIGARRQVVKSANYSAATGAATSAYDKSVTTPGVGLVVKPRENLSLYANYIEGLQQGPTATAGASNAGQVFAPYVSKQHEVGVKYDFGRVTATLSAYQLKTPNGFTDPATLVYGIDGEQRTRGIEVNTFGEIAHGLRILGGVALVDAKQTKTLGGANDGRDVTGAPKTQVNLGAELDIRQLPGLTVSARVIRTGAQYVDLANRQPIPGWTRYDAGLRYRMAWGGTATTLRLNVQNLLNKSYWASAIDTYLVQSTPRTVQLSATFDF